MPNFSVDSSGNATVVEDPLTILIDGWSTLDHIMDSKQPNISVADKLDWYFELVSTSMNYLGMLEVASAIRSLNDTPAHAPSESLTERLARESGGGVCVR